MSKLALPLPFLLAFLTAISPLAVDMNLPAMPAIAADLNTSIHLAELSISAYLIGFAIGQFSGGPLSDRFGRRPMIVIGLGLFSLSSLLLTQVTRLEPLLILRVLQALGGGLAVVNSSAIVRDLFQGVGVAKTLSMISMITMAAPLLAPVFGAIALAYSTWHSIFWFLCIYSALALILLLWQLPESHPKEKRRQKISFKEYWRVVTHKRARRIILALSLSYSGMFIFITASSYLYMEHFGFNASQFPWLFGANIIVMIGMNRLNIQLLNRYSSQQVLAFGLILQGTAALLLVSLFLFKPDVSIWYILPLMMVFVGTLGLIGSNSVAMILHHFKDISATANALTGVSQFTSGALAGFIWAHLHNGTPLPMVSLMFITAATALVIMWLIPKDVEQEV
ncbi:MAG: Bcr/CflA family multidrug efflux MFS transporter [Venatoribacter sp.]